MDYSQLAVVLPTSILGGTVLDCPLPLSLPEHLMTERAIQTYLVIVLNKNSDSSFRYTRAAK